MRWKKTAKRWIMAVAAAGILFVTIASPVFAEVDTGAVFQVESDSWEFYSQAPGISAATGVLIDADTGAVLYAKGMDEQRYPASITKIMTALLVLQNCSLDAQVTMTETGLADAYDGSANINSFVGEVFTVDQCLQMLLVKSANDVATQLAEFVSGSVSAFVDLMNQTAVSLGCTNTHFVNANGLENEQHYTSAHDMALIMNAALQYPRFREILGMTGIAIDSLSGSETRFYLTHNEMIVPDSQYYYEGCLGGKTGYTDVSLCTLASVAERDGMTLIGVVMGSTGTEQSFVDMTALFNYGYSTFQKVEGTWGYAVISDGAVTVPKSVRDMAVLTFEGNPTDVDVAVSIRLGDRQVGSAVMTQENYEELYSEMEKRQEQIAKEEAEKNKQEETDNDQNGRNDETAAGSSSGSSSSSESAGPEDLLVEEQSNSSSTGKLFLYVAIAILSVLIVIGIVMIVKNSSRARRRRKNRKK